MRLAPLWLAPPLLAPLSHIGRGAGGEGSIRKAGSTRKADVLRQMEVVAREIPVTYPSGPAICAEYARHATRLKTAGTPIGGNDLWIACHALAEKAILVTNNVREFERVEGLQVENWALQAR